MKDIHLIISTIIISFVAFALVIWTLYTIFFGKPSILTYFNQYQSDMMEPLMALMILICTFAYMILAAPLFLRGLKNVITFGKYPITDYKTDGFRIGCTLIPPFIVGMATWFCYYYLSLPARLLQHTLTYLILPMALICAAILIFYVLSYLYFRGDLKC